MAEKHTTWEEGAYTSQVDLGGGKSYWGIFTKWRGQTKHRFKSKKEAIDFLDSKAYCVVPEGTIYPEGLNCFLKLSQADTESKKVLRTEKKGSRIMHTKVNRAIDLGMKVRRK